ncbi:hypothetical protein [Pseudonocardia acaciae]|uniref:hypothetical protein n=1 Tax=Pseudonocardia acaciae TaxID=551276 RepID=UPI0005657A8B|nr:hypothetical protein [Pseudonocardia acaciae]
MRPARASGSQPARGQERAERTEPGNAAGIVVYQNVWAAPFVAAVHRAGGQLLAEGRIPVQDLAAALDSTETVGA